MKFNLNTLASNNNPGVTTSVNAVVQAGISLLLVIVGVVALITLIMGGIRYLSSGGDQKAVAGARKQIEAAIIGLVITFLSFMIIRIVETFFYIQLLSIPF